MSGSTVISSSALGRRGKTSHSPSYSLLHSPTPSTSQSHLASLPRIKLNLRSAPSPSFSTSTNKGKPGRQTYSRTSSTKNNHRNNNSTSNGATELKSSKPNGNGNGNGVDGEGTDSSELTPQSSDVESDAEMGMDVDGVEEEDEDEGQGVTPRLLKNQNSHISSTPTKKSGQKGNVKGKRRSSVGQAQVNGKGKETVVVKNKIVTSGPGGRERRKLMKNGERERRRERDEKFGLAEEFGVTTPMASAPRPSSLLDTDANSSYGDDDMSDNEQAPSLLNGLGHESDEEFSGLPEAFAGQEIEDLAYGAGPAELEMERAVLSGWWNNEEEDDDEMLITHLSGSEAERKSQSSDQASEEDDSMSEGDASSFTDNELDEFGFPKPAAIAEKNEDAPLVLMENWDGQFVLVQPRQEKETSRSRSRRREGSRRDSIGGSTIGSTLADGGGLIIDADANVGEFDSDTDSLWSGVSDEDDGGDTTDSMEEDDMPMLDSPALQQLIDDQIGGVKGLIPGVGLAVNGVSSSIEVGGGGAPAIVITDMTTSIPETPALSTGSTVTPNFNPVAGPSTPNAPLMGTFHPATDHPAQHAVIDGSGIPTKSPFTHRRRTRATRDESMTSTTRSGSQRKRKSSLQTLHILQQSQHQSPCDPFSPTITSTLPKRARYSSIPGHPRFIQAKRERARIAAMMNDEEDEEDYDTDSGVGEEEVDEEGGVAEIGLEEMLETSLLAHGTVDEDEGEGEEDGFRFDRVPVSTYLRRHFRTAGLETPLQDQNTYPYQYQYQSFSSPVTNRRGRTGPVSIMGNGIQDTLVQGGNMIWGGPGMGMGMMSPFLAPVVEEQSQGVMSRRERRRGRKRGFVGDVVEDLGVGMPALSI